jgi:hypothetical protein
MLRKIAIGQLPFRCNRGGITGHSSGKVCPTEFCAFGATSGIILLARERAEWQKYKMVRDARRY